jgi:very-short-patch-repair endonuclease
LSQRIIKQKLEKYLHVVIESFKRGKSESVLSDFNQEMMNPSSENILKYFYFYKYYLRDSNESENALNILEDILIKQRLENREICFFYFDYGSLCPRALDSIYKLYHNQSQTQKNFITMTRILMYNDCTDWEERCFDRFHLFENHPFEYRVSRLINHKFGEEKIKLAFNNKYFKPEISTSQVIHTNLISNELGLHCEKETRFHDYVIDIYIPSLETVVETDGPDHFYPLQSQFKNRNKFRYKYLHTFFKKKLVSLPYFEICRQDNDYLLGQWIYKLIYSEYDLFESELFKTNFDLLKPIWKFNKVKVNSKSNLLNKI